MHLAKNSSFVRALSRERLKAPGSTTNISGLQGSNTPTQAFLGFRHEALRASAWEAIVFHDRVNTRKTNHFR